MVPPQSLTQGHAAGGHHVPGSESLALPCLLGTLGTVFIGTTDAIKVPFLKTPAFANLLEGCLLDLPSWPRGVAGAPLRGMGGLGTL